MSVSFAVVGIGEKVVEIERGTWRRRFPDGTQDSNIGAMNESRRRGRNSFYEKLNDVDSQGRQWSRLRNRAS